MNNNNRLDKKNYPVIAEFNEEDTEYEDGDVVTPAYDRLGNQRTNQQNRPVGANQLLDLIQVGQRANYMNITADTLVKTGQGLFYGFIVNSHTGGSVKVYDNVAGSGAVVCNTITFPAGSSLWVFPVGIPFSIGLYLDISGTVDLTPLVL